MKKKHKEYQIEKFFQSIDNKFDRGVNQSIQELNNAFDEIGSDLEYWATMSQNNPKEYNEAEERINEFGSSISEQMHEKINNGTFIEEELSALYEMKIIYSFKHLEINLKRFLIMFYEDNSISKTYKWENIIEYLKGRNIDLSNIAGYKEVNELRNVNNSLKHSINSLDKSLNSIKEFKNNSTKDHSNLSRFYERIEDSSILFLSSLSEEIIKEFYDFNDTKIKILAEHVTTGMNKETSEKLILKIKDIFS
ncbi:hypothetical protein [Ulvibacter antarcticus]|uniref:Uncharacterized protein n=1 Tax=Ulvibacter antarcticus TaxID=442714 RepID=A0A3L9Z6F0_9FLAO|nr:hypothetical protein [Ulvibacter antarcticus]RMA67710.1 hypothetical protein BXY75_0020 [Ulvibacter antarcticus]